MIKDIACQHCKKPQAKEQLKNDENLNVICQFCDKIILSVTGDKEPPKSPPTSHIYPTSPRREMLPIVTQDEETEV